MTELSPGDRPREKVEQSGTRGLGDNELLAIILGEGVRECNALELASRMLAEVGGVRGLARASRDQLCRRKGVGPTRAVRIMAAVELGRRTLLPGDALPEPIRNAHDVVALLAPQFGARNAEHFGVVLLDVRHRVLRTVVLSTGASDGTSVDPRQVFQEALAAKAHAVIAFHNHPSGDPTPSSDDLVVTQRLRTAGEVMGIDVLDHVIVANDTYYSFKEALAPPEAEPRRKRRRVAE